jgi:ketosteroid isomerase-like protein
MRAAKPYALRPTIAVVAFLIALAGCGQPNPQPLDASYRKAVADTIRNLMVNAYDLTKPGDAVARLMSLYPDSGRVISASGGQVSTTRDSLAMGIRTFWTFVGQNMKDPKWEWGPMLVDVLAPDAAAVTATYRVPHRTPRGDPHVIAGAWTAVFQRRGGRWVIIQEHLSDLPEALAMPGMSSTMPGMSGMTDSTRDTTTRH